MTCGQILFVRNVQTRERETRDESELLRAEGGVGTKDDNKFQQPCLIFNSAGRDASMEKAERAGMLTWHKTEFMKSLDHEKFLTSLPWARMSPFPNSPPVD